MFATGSKNPTFKTIKYTQKTLNGEASFPANLLATDDEYLETTLFINAWDPHSYLGNGNNADKSMDGYFGRYCAIGYRGIPAVNPMIYYLNIYTGAT